jgi:hypothetical protein
MWNHRLMVHRPAKPARIRELSTLAAACALLVASGEPARGMDAGAGTAAPTKAISREAGVGGLVERSAVSDNTTARLMSVQDAQPPPVNIWWCETWGPFPPDRTKQYTLMLSDRRYIPKIADQCLQEPQTCNPENVACAGRLLHTLGLEQQGHAHELEGKIASAASVENSDLVEQMRERLQRHRQLGNELLQEAADYYEKTLKLPQTARIDDLLMNLGGVYTFLKQDRLAIEHYQRLIQDVPISKHLPFAYLAIGQIRFASGDWQGAERSYAMVLSLPPSPAVTCALYKQAWTDFKRGFTSLARKGFEACRKLQPGPVGKKYFVEFMSRACTADAKRLGLLRD